MWNPTTMELMPGFWEPRPSPFWNVTLTPLRRFYLRRFYGIAKIDLVGTENLTEAVGPDDGVLIAPNHSHDSDPHVMMQVGHDLKRQLYFMAAWQVFLAHWGIDGWVMQRFGAFSVDREGCDRRAMRKAVELLTGGKSLVVFPEGEIYHTNERLTPLREGVAFFAVTAQRDLDKQGSGRQIWVVPTAIRYRYVDDITPLLNDSMSELEGRIARHPAPGEPLSQRIVRFGEAMLTLKEKEQLGRAYDTDGELPARLTRLINAILERHESKHLGHTSPEESVPVRVKTLRRHLLEVMCDEKAAEPARREAHDALPDLHLALQLYSYPGDYVSTKPTVERMAETIEKFEEDLLGAARPKGRRAATVVFGKPLDVKQHATARARTAATDLTARLEQSITELMKNAVPMLMALLLFITSAVRAATPQQIDASIDRAVKFLYSQQKDSSWEEKPRATDEPSGFNGAQFGGRSAIATYALLAAGENPQDERLVRAVEFLSKVDSAGPYCAGMRCQVWSHLPQTQKTRQLLSRDARILLAGMRDKGESRGLYWYVPGRDDKYDHSVSQFAVLGIWACAERDIEVPGKFWQEADRAWRAHQQSSGAWNYCLTGSPGQTLQTPSMTAAGIATLFLTRDFTRATEGINCKGNIVDPNIDKGMQWIADNFSAVYDPRRQLDGYDWSFYTLYGIERIGVASGFKYLGTIDWYKRGSDYLLRTQAANGSWTGGCGAVADTALAILFLTRGRAPVMINKLQYDHASGEAGRWNQRPRDVANLTRWVGRQIERDLNWQTVNLKVSPDELHDAPILYISGDQALDLPDDSQAKLRQFAQQGGLIIGHADGKSAGFAKSFRELGQKLFPYEFRELPADHPIYADQQFPRSKWTTTPSVLGLSNGVRELMLLLPDSDAGKFWQLQSFDRKELFQLGADVFLYSVDKQNLRNKGETHIFKLNPATSAQKQVKLVRLQHEGNWDPEPGGWKRLGAILHNENGVDLIVTSAKPGAGKLAGNGIAHLTGTEKFTLDDKARSEIRKFVDQGGVLIVDSAGGSARFTAAAESELAAIFGDRAKSLSNPIAADDPLFSRMEIRYRTAARKVLGGLNAPQLRVIAIDGRPAVYFSREDLSAGLVGQAVDGVVGYEPGISTELMRRMLMRCVK